MAIPETDDEACRRSATSARSRTWTCSTTAACFARQTRDATGLAIVLQRLLRPAGRRSSSSGPVAGRSSRRLQTCLGSMGTPRGERRGRAKIWDVQGKFRLRVGAAVVRPVRGLPARPRRRRRQRKAFFLLGHLARLYVGPELDFDVQLVLRAADVPECQLTRRAARAAAGLEHLADRQT